ncbi:Uncharacterised protein [Fusobacterium necrophorum subsp. necrophorum]|nr:hypothetical protein [Fusobacterium necrophorum]SQD08819.1 Uncharacterised protein [Fusobacterium necrophorum subsp. necrophorum]
MKKILEKVLKNNEKRKKMCYNVKNKINLYNLRCNSVKKVVLFCLLSSMVTYGLDRQELHFLDKMTLNIRKKRRLRN